MPLQETLDTFSYFITEADKLNLSYLTLVRYHPSFDVEIDGMMPFIDRDPKWKLINQNRQKSSNQI